MASAPVTNIVCFTCNPFQTNCFLAHSAGEAVLVDASSFEPHEHARIEHYIRQHGLRIRRLLLTHAHIDHLYGCAHFEKRFSLQWEIHPEANPMLKQAAFQAMLLGAPSVDVPGTRPTLREGDTIEFGDSTWQILHTPGHAPGSVCFVDADSGFILVGDVLFKGSIGRTDLPSGSLPILMRSIYDKLMPLPDDTVVYSGHGPATTIGQERRNNPFLH